MPEATAALYLGIDIGSTATKAIAFDSAGAPLAVGSSGYSVARSSSDRAEQDALDWARAVDECVGQVASSIDLSGIQSIGVTGQVDTHVFVDADFAPVAPALLWQDVRCSDEADALNERLGADGRFSGWGSVEPIDASNPVPRALWFAAHEPELWARTAWVLFPKDFINARLTGRVTSDPFASFKVVGADARYVSGVANAPGLAERLAPLRAPESGMGHTLVAWHGIPAGTIVATGSMDGIGNVLGSGLSRPGDTMVIIGTSVIVGSIGVGGTSGPGVVNFAPYRSKQVHAGPTQSGGDSLRWWASASGHTIDEVLDAAASSPPGARGVVFAPHLLGERAPLWDSEVRAWFIGLHSGVQFADLCRAVLEGVAYSARELLDAVSAAGRPAGPTEVTATTASALLSGGGSRSDLWCQIFADVTGRTMNRSVERDTAVVGAATLAVAAHTGMDPWQAATQMARSDVSFLPDAGLASVYDSLFTVYRSTYQSLTDVHHELRSVRSGL